MSQTLGVVSGKMLDAMDWITVVVGLVSGGAAGGLALGVMRSEIHALRRELEVIRSEQQAEARECRANITAILRTLAQGGQQ